MVLNWIAKSYLPLKAQDAISCPLNKNRINNETVIHIKKYTNLDLGYNYRMTNMQAAIGFSQLKIINNIIESKDMGKNLKPFAIYGKDNTIEGFFHNELPITGVMWHPERNPDENSIQLFLSELVWLLVTDSVHTFVDVILFTIRLINESCFYSESRCLQQNRKHTPF